MPTDTVPEVCHYLEWDSQFFGVRIARLVERRLTPESIAAAERWCAGERIACVYFLADASDLATARLTQGRRVNRTRARRRPHCRTGRDPTGAKRPSRRYHGQAKAAACRSGPRPLPQMPVRLGHFPAQHRRV